jgi:hypothetical protein
MSAVFVGFGSLNQTINPVIAIFISAKNNLEKPELISSIIFVIIKWFTRKIAVMILPRGRNYEAMENASIWKTKINDPIMDAKIALP